MTRRDSHLIRGAKRLPAGGLISYGTSFAAINRQVGVYVGKDPEGREAGRSARTAADHSRIEPSVPRETTKVSREGLVSARLAATEKAARRDPDITTTAGVFRGTDDSNPASSSGESATGATQNASRV